MCASFYIVTDFKNISRRMPTDVYICVVDRKKDSMSAMNVKKLTSYSLNARINPISEFINFRLLKKGLNRI